MASTLTAPKNGKKENGKMASSVVAPQDPTKITGKISKKVDNPVNGKKMVRNGEYVLPAIHNGNFNEVLGWNFVDGKKGEKVAKKTASSIEQAYSLVGSDEKEILRLINLAFDVESVQDDLTFWANQGRKNAARQQTNLAIDFDLGSEDLNDLLNAYNNAMKNLNDDKTTEEEYEANKKFVLSGKKFAPLKEVLANIKMDDLVMDFSEIELRKPTGVRGKVKKTATGSTTTNEDDDSGDDE